MGTRARSRPKRLPSKLHAIRQTLNVSQAEMAQQLDVNSGSRISEYESGTREPSLLVLLRYSDIADVLLNDLVDDDAELVFGSRKTQRHSS